MFVYQVNISIDREVEEDWVKWMKADHIPDVMKTGFFETYQIRKAIATDEKYITRYAIEYACRSLENYEAYQKGPGPALQKAHAERYRDQFTATRAFFEIIAE